MHVRAHRSPSQRAASLHVSAARRFLIQHAQQVGKYLVTSMIRRNTGGHYTAAVSIRSGRGSMTHDRVMRFEPLFDSPHQAARFATDRALAWIGVPSTAATFPPDHHKD